MPEQDKDHAYFKELKHKIIDDLAAPPSTPDEMMEHGGKVMAWIKHLQNIIRDGGDKYRGAAICLGWFTRTTCCNFIKQQDLTLHQTMRFMDRAEQRALTRCRVHLRAACAVADALVVAQNNNINAHNVSDDEGGPMDDEE